MTSAPVSSWKPRIIERGGSVAPDSRRALLFHCRVEGLVSVFPVRENQRGLLGTPHRIRRKRPCQRCHYQSSFRLVFCSVAMLTSGMSRSSAHWCHSVALLARSAFSRL